MTFFALILLAVGSLSLADEPKPVKPVHHALPENRKEAPAKAEAGPKVLPYGFLNVDSPKIPAELKAAVEEVAKSTVYIQLVLKKDVEGGKKGQVVSSGSGAVTEPGDRVETVQHVIDLAEQHPDELEIQILDHEGKQLELNKIETSDKERDFAVLSLKKKSANFLPRLSNKEVRKGTRVVTAGYPTGHRVTRVSLGMFLQKEDGKFFFSNPTLPGSSGGPVVVIGADNKVKGVVGAVQGLRAMKTHKLGDGITIALDYSTLSNLASNVGIATSIKEPIKAFKITGTEEEGYKSEVLAGLFPNDPLIFAMKHNFHNMRAKHVIDSDLAALDEAISELRLAEKQVKDGADVRGLRTTVGPRISDANYALEKLSHHFIDQVGVIINVPFLSDPDIMRKMFDKKTKPEDVRDELRRQILIIASAKEQLLARKEQDLKKMKLLESEHELSKYLINLSKNPKLRDGEEYLNDLYPYLPTMASPNEGE